MRVITYKNHKTKIGYNNSRKTYYFFMKILDNPTLFEAPTRLEAINIFRKTVDYFINVAT